MANNHFYLKAEECYIEEDTQYWSTEALGDEITYAGSASECKEYCETTFPEEAKFFVFYTEDADHLAEDSAYNSACRCKTDKGTKQKQKSGGCIWQLELWDPW